MPRPASRVSSRSKMLASTLLAGAIALTAGSGARAQESWPMAGRDASHTGRADGPAPPYKVAWELEGRNAPATGVAATEEAVIVLSAEGVLALDPADGGVLWERGRSSGPVGVPAIAGNLVIHARDDGVSGQLVARDIATGDIAWQATIGSAAAGGPTVADGRVFVGTVGGEVIALEVTTGKERWRFETVGEVAGAPAVAGEVVVAASYQGTSGRSTVYALDAASGAENGTLWQYSAGPVGPPSAPSIADDLVIIGLSDLEVRGFDVEDGAEVWSFSARDGFGPRQIPAAGDVLLVADRTHLYRLDPASGLERWTWLLADLSAVSPGRVETLLASAPSVSGSTVLLGDARGELSAIDIDSGHRIWRRDLGEGAVGPIAITSDRVYAVTLGDGGSLQALEHDAEGTLIDEISPTVLAVGEGVINFAGAAAAVGLAIWLLFRFALRPRTESP